MNSTLTMYDVVDVEMIDGSGTRRRGLTALFGI